VALNYKRLIEAVTRVYGSGSPADRRACLRDLRGVFEDAGERRSFDLGKLFAEMYGIGEWYNCRSDRTYTATQVMEKAGAVNTAAFVNITGQWAYTAYIEGYDAPELVFKNLIPTRQSPFKFERVPGITAIGDEALVVDEAEDYPIAGVSEQWTETPETLKRGFIVPVTWEALFFDRTGRLRERVTDLGTWMGVNREKRAIDCVIDAGETAQNKYRYKWMGNSIATYGDNSGTHNWDNLAASNALTDYTNVQAVWTLLMGMTDPFTGEPIYLQPKDLVVPPSLVWNVPFVTGGTLSRVTPGYATTGNPLKVEIPNPTSGIVGTWRQWSSQLLQARMTAASVAANTWFAGDIEKAFEYIENLAPEVTTAPAGSEAEFTKDIVLRTKVREMGTYNTRQPRAMVKATVA
jgi:hypothetical protein